MAREENMGMMMMMMMQYALQYLLRMVPPSENGKHENDQIWLAGKRNRQTRISSQTLDQGTQHHGTGRDSQSPVKEARRPVDSSHPFITPDGLLSHKLFSGNLPTTIPQTSRQRRRRKSKEAIRTGPHPSSSSSIHTGSLIRLHCCPTRHKYLTLHLHTVKTGQPGWLLACLRFFTSPFCLINHFTRLQSYALLPTNQPVQSRQLFPCLSQSLPLLLSPLPGLPRVEWSGVVGFREKSHLPDLLGCGGSAANICTEYKFSACRTFLLQLPPSQKYLGYLTP
ncbi:hypothetical protein BKA61DRAFT_151147 [Leptodontidium sp. MPI-SDFR-AT-0119]|nr:hypothetical protein BKA61DRAFT_151147 [Leptodontidium sp. MPI-SDFR-AT-0119]